MALYEGQVFIFDLEISYSYLFLMQQVLTSTQNEKCSPFKLADNFFSGFNFSPFNFTAFYVNGTLMLSLSYCRVIFETNPVFGKCDAR
jgi:hypothetical protein